MSELAKIIDIPVHLYKQTAVEWLHMIYFCTYEFHLNTG
jgi:hypothetical protein